MEQDLQLIDLQCNQKTIIDESMNHIMAEKSCKDLFDNIWNRKRRRILKVVYADIVRRVGDRANFSVTHK